MARTRRPLSSAEDAESRKARLEDSRNGEEHAQHRGEQAYSPLELRDSRRTLGSDDSTSGTLITAGRARRIHPAAVDLGTPTRVAMDMSPESWTSWMRRWSYVRRGRFRVMTRRSRTAPEKGSQRASPGVPSLSDIRRKCSDGRDEQQRDGREVRESKAREVPGRPDRAGSRRGRSELVGDVLRRIGLSMPR